MLFPDDPDVDQLLEDMWQFLQVSQYRISYPDVAWIQDRYDSSYKELWTTLQPYILKKRWLQTKDK
jgi:hypothetical protein